MVLFLLFLMLGTTHAISAKVLVITHNVNGPQFVAMQQKTFKKFLKNDYKYVVFNDAKTESMAQEINDACKACSATCVRVPQSIHTQPYLPREAEYSWQLGAIRHANCVQYSLDVLGFDHDGPVLLIDSDMFLIRPFDIEKYMENKDIAAYVKGASKKIRYLCPAFTILHMSKLPDKRTMNFNWGVVNGKRVDSGGWTYFYLIKHPELKISHSTYLPSYDLYLGNYDIAIPVDHSVSDAEKIATYQKHGFNDKEIKFLLKKPDTFEFFHDNMFLHYHEGSKYTNRPDSYYQNKWRIFSEFFEDILSD